MVGYSAVYGWFTEGRNTPDLLAAAALHDSLIANASQLNSQPA